jgi:hypothetical protein
MTVFRDTKKANQHYAGKKFGDLTLRQRVRTKAGASGGQKWRMECVCGNMITAPIFYVVRAAHPKTHCGCKAKDGVNPYPREKGIWQMMNRRCLYSTHVAYKDYGGAGIKVCDDWIETNPDGWQNFIDYVGPAPTPTHTLDRKNPFLNYEPGNVRWATRLTQANNQKRHWLEKYGSQEAAMRAGYDG